MRDTVINNHQLFLKQQKQQQKQQKNRKTMLNFRELQIKRKTKKRCVKCALDTMLLNCFTTNWKIREVTGKGDVQKQIV